MQKIELIDLISKIVKESAQLKNKHTPETSAPVNYACIFSKDNSEFTTFKKLAGQIGKVVEETPTGPLYQVSPIPTVSGPLQLLKIRRPDITKLERGDADFTVKNYQTFKAKYLPQTNFGLIRKNNFEMIELTDPAFNVRAYFSNPPLDEQLGIK